MIKTSFNIVKIMREFSSYLEKITALEKLWEDNKRTASLEEWHVYNQTYTNLYDLEKSLLAEYGLPIYHINTFVWDYYLTDTIKSFVSHVGDRLDFPFSDNPKGCKIIVLASYYSKNMADYVTIFAVKPKTGHFYVDRVYSRYPVNIGKLKF